MALPAAWAQADNPPLAEGTHLLRRILWDQGIQPLSSFQELADQPETKLLIVLGETSVLDQVPNGLLEFVHQGGAVLIATDREARTQPFHVLGFGVSGRQVRFASKTEFAYLGLADCVIVRPLERGQPIFQGLTKVATNRPSFLIRLGGEEQRLDPMGLFPRNSVYPDKDALYSAAYRPFVAGGDLDKGRVLILSDHSVFINAMMWQEDNDNFRFANNCVAWLSEAKPNRRTEALVVEEGRIQTRFDIPLKEEPLPPLPPLHQQLQFANAVLRGLETENRFNEVILRAVNSVHPANWLRSLVVLLTMALGVYGLVRLGQAKQRLEPGAPLLETSLVQLVPPLETQDQRRRAMLREGNFWEAAQALARQGFVSIPGLAVQPGGSLTPRNRAKLPRVVAMGNWWQRWRVRRQVYQLWRLAVGDRPERVTARRLAQLRVEIDDLKAQLSAGRIQIHGAG
jgi:hypothetical protein